MAHTTRQVTYQLQVTGAEMKLIGQGLVALAEAKARSKTGHEAALLNVALLKQMETLVGTEAEVVHGALEKAEKMYKSLKAIEPGGGPLDD